MTRYPFKCVAASILLALAGCGDGFPQDESTIDLVGADSGRVFYQYHKRYTGFETLPSSLWSLDLNAETAERIAESTRQFGVQAEGDFVVREFVRDGGTKGRVVATRISTGKTITLHQRTLHPGVSESAIHRLSGQRAVVLTPGGLLVFELPNPEPTMTLALPADTFALTAFQGDLVLVQRGIEYTSESLVLVDLSTGEQREIPPPPASDPNLFNAILSRTTIAVSTVAQAGESMLRNQVLLFDFPTGPWRVLAEDEPYGPNVFIPPFLLVAGHDEERVIVMTIQAGNPEGESLIESIDNVSAARTVIERSQSLVSAPVSLLLRDERLYWIDPIFPVLIARDLDSGAEKVVPLRLPG